MRHLLNNLKESIFSSILLPGVGEGAVSFPEQSSSKTNIEIGSIAARRVVPRRHGINLQPW